MKKYKAIILFTVLSHLAISQTINITGTVKNLKGDALHNAFVKDKTVKNGTFTDRAGSFALAVNPSAVLMINCPGYNDTSVYVDNKTFFSVVLTPSFGVIAKPITAAASTVVNPTVNENFRDQINFSGNITPTYAGVPIAVVPKNLDGTAYHNEVALGEPHMDMMQGAIYPVFSAREETRGSRYLFNSWVYGYVISSADSIIQNTAYFFNYDKIGGGLLFSKNKREAVEVTREKIKSFKLYGEDGKSYVFENVPAIDKRRYAEVIEEGSTYKIYKLVTTEFVKSNYATNGITTTGNPYDEFVDKVTYYYVKNKSGTPHLLALKKKALKEAFSDEPGKINQYLADNNGDIDDTYLKELGDYMNRSAK